MKKYKVIYADPPWSYDAGGRPNGGVDKHYSTMPIEDICALPVEEITDDNAILFLWVTFPTLVDGMKVFSAWGFEYKTLGFAWIKTNKRQNLKQTSFLPTDKIDDVFGVGYYTKSNCEVCLIGVKGKVSELIKDKSIRSTIISPRQEHSKKPNEARKRIEKLCGDVNRLEMFARQKTKGWDVFGNEVEGSIEIK